jgi:hypothetical protein
MNNPYFPNRKIRHANLLKEAGFEIDLAWYRDKDNRVGNPNPTNVTKLIYWKRGDIRVTLFDYQQISLSKLIDRIEGQVKYNYRQKARVVFNS